MRGSTEKLRISTLQELLMHMDGISGLEVIKRFRAISYFQLNLLIDFAV